MQDGIYKLVVSRPGHEAEIAIATTNRDLWSGGSANFYFYGMPSGAVGSFQWHPINSGTGGILTGLDHHLMYHTDRQNPLGMNLELDQSRGPINVRIDLELLQSFPL